MSSVRVSENIRIRLTAKGVTKLTSDSRKNDICQLDKSSSVPLAPDFCRPRAFVCPGTNVIAARLPKLDKPTIIFGADVTHAATDDETAPSIAAVVARYALE